MIGLQGGSPPFNLLIIGSLQPLTNISIPSEAFQNNKGQFTTQLKYAFTSRIALSMSDATGETAGGITPVLTVADSVSGKTCNTTSKHPDFVFSLDADLEECKSFPFSEYTDAVQPVVVTAFIAGGQSFQLFPPVGDNFTFANDNLTAGSSVFFAMTDSKGRDGGTSDIRTVRLSSTGAHCAANAVPSSGSTFRKAAWVVGAAVGTVIVIALIGLSVYLYARKNRRSGFSRIKVYKSREVPDLLYDPQEDGGHADQDLQEAHEITPFEQQEVHSEPPRASMKTRMMMGVTNRVSSSSILSDYDVLTGSSSSSSYPPGLGPRQTSKYSANQAQPGSSHQSLGRGRIVVHTDIAEDDVPMELPPQYSDSRAPIPGLPSSLEPTVSQTTSSTPVAESPPQPTFYPEKKR
ncbi:hypothetical protein CPC08DRAFT_406267 [Agrocybe pediades]|nr:hypothetical protein CPC08DRAFT_406267 [Agrocybe pediades]